MRFGTRHCELSTHTCLGGLGSTITESTRKYLYRLIMTLLFDDIHSLDVPHVLLPFLSHRRLHALELEQLS